MPNCLKQLFLALGALAFASCATQPRVEAAAAPAQQAAAAAVAGAEVGARPALWRFGDSDTTIYLFGTIHLLPEGVAWRTPALERAIAESDELVTEVVMPEDAGAVAQTMVAMGMQPGLPPILERVPEEDREPLRDIIARTGIPIQAFDQMKTWTAALMLAGVIFQQLGLDPQLGVEHGLTASWREAQKPVQGLETIERQFGFFDGLSEESQRAFLSSLVDEPQAMQAQFQEMLAAWMSGDTDAIARTFDVSAKMTEELRRVLLEQRNRQWADWLVQRLERPGTVLVAVGAGHLAGEDSVQAMLAERGIRVERVQ